MTVPYVTMEKKAGLAPVAGAGARRRALSLSPGLTEIDGSHVPGSDRLHVRGPQQMPADPDAAGLDTATRVATATERRVVSPANDLKSDPVAPSAPTAGTVASTDEPPAPTPAPAKAPSPA